MIEDVLAVGMRLRVHRARRPVYPPRHHPFEYGVDRGAKPGCGADRFAVLERLSRNACENERVEFPRPAELASASQLVAGDVGNCGRTQAGRAGAVGLHRSPTLERLRQSRTPASTFDRDVGAARKPGADPRRARCLPASPNTLHHRIRGGRFATSGCLWKPGDRVDEGGEFSRKRLDAIENRRRRPSRS